MIERPEQTNLTDCNFCRRISVGHFISESNLVVVFRDAYPVTPGHVHIAPRRHVESFFELAPEEREAMLEMVDRAREWADEEHSPDGYNIGINVGEAAGQTVAHCNIHLIPRYRGDSPDPRGGVRWVQPERAPYLDGRV